jgi:hypothetical protein
MLSMVLPVMVDNGDPLLTTSPTMLVGVDFGSVDELDDSIEVSEER